MNRRLYRLTPAGGKPNHYTDSYASALAKLGPAHAAGLDALAVGEKLSVHDVALEPQFEVWGRGTWERVA